MRINRSITTVWAIGCLAATPACNAQLPGKGGDSSQAKALEDLASGTTDGGQRTCQGDQPVVIPSARIVVDLGGGEPSPALYSSVTDAAQRSEHLTAAVRTYLSAVPADVQRAFLTLGGIVVVTDKAATLCAASMDDPTSPNFVAASGRTLDACFLWLSKSSKAAGSLPASAKALLGPSGSVLIVQSADAGKIATSGVRTFGFLHAQLYPRLVAGSKDGVATYQVSRAEAEALVKEKQTLATAFLKDMAASKAFDLTALEPVLGSGAAAQIRSNLAAATDPLTGVGFAYPGDPATVPEAQTANTRKRRFYDFVFADAFDSLHCSAATLAAAKRNFAKTYAAFAPVDQALMAGVKIMAGPSGGMALAEDRPVGLALTGEGMPPDPGALDQFYSLLFPYNPGNTSVTNAAPLGRANERNPTVAPDDPTVLTNISGAFGYTPDPYDPLMGGSGYAYAPPEALGSAPVFANSYAYDNPVMSLLGGSSGGPFGYPDPGTGAIISL